MSRKIISFFKFLKLVILEFIDDNVLKYSASLSYYTIFSLAPMLIIIIAVCSLLFGREALLGEMYGQIKDLVGSDAAIQIQDTIKNIHLSKNTPFATSISLLALLVGATGIFGEIQDSLNRIWGLKIITKRVWWKLILNRILSFSLILSLGFILAVSLLLNVLVAALGNRLNHIMNGMGDTLIPFIDKGLSFIITTLLFATIFKMLPDAKVKWKDVIIGGIITSLLFMLGRFGIGYYLGKTNLATVYGAAGSVIIIMVWAYYSSAILYLGAEFTKVYAKLYGGKILPNEFSVWIIVEEVPVPNVTLKEEVTHNIAK